MATSHALYDLAAHPEYVAPLREEIEQVIAEDGYEVDGSGMKNLKKQSLPKLKKLDSFLKESQRFSPPGLGKLFPFIFPFGLSSLLHYLIERLGVSVILTQKLTKKKTSHKPPSNNLPSPSPHRRHHSSRHTHSLQRPSNQHFRSLRFSYNPTTNHRPPNQILSFPFLHSP